VKRLPRRKTNRKAKKTEPTQDQILRYMQCMMDEHQMVWHTTLVSSQPRWRYLLNMHMRMVELEHMQRCLEELP